MIEDRVLRLENAFSTLVELARTQCERMDEDERRTEELTQAQKELSDEQKPLTKRLKEPAESQKGLAQAQKQAEADLSALTIIMADLGRAQRQTDQAIAKSAERVDRNIRDHQE
jgi:hypothetical protein